MNWELIACGRSKELFVFLLEKIYCCSQFATFELLTHSYLVCLNILQVKSTPLPSPTVLKETAKDPIKALESRVTAFQLPNGLRFVVLERHVAPVLACHTYVNVCSNALSRIDISFNKRNEDCECRIYAVFIGFFGFK